MSDKRATSPFKLANVANSLVRAASKNFDISSTSQFGGGGGNGIV